MHSFSSCCTAFNFRIIYEDPRETYEVNTLGTLNILEVSRKCKSIKSVICITSDKCYESNYSTKGFKESG